jgi:hypothetical protein
MILMENPNIELRKLGDGTWSVMARVFNPQKKFYEHRDYINLKKEEAEKYCWQIIEQKPSIEEIENTWVYIGD